MYNQYILEKLAQDNRKMAEEKAAQYRLCKQATAGTPGPLAQALAKIAGLLADAGEGLKGLSEREALLNS
jgi:hypothetical protein